MNLLSLKMKKGYFLRSDDDFLKMQRQRGRNNKGKLVRGNRSITNVDKARIGMNIAAKNPKQNWIQPEFRLQKFKWAADYGNITNSGSAYAGKMMYSNNLYDPDPALLTSSVAGYADNMKFYFYCLPIKVTARVVVTNREAFPVKCCLVSTINQVDTLFSSTQNIIDLGENAQSTPWTEISSAGGQDRATLTLTTNFGLANGNEFEYNGNAATYSCQPTSGPPYPMFISLLVWATSNFTSSGVGVSWQYTWSTRLWARNVILDSGPVAELKVLNKILLEKESYRNDVEKQLLALKALVALDDAHAKIFEQLQGQYNIVSSELLDLKATIDNPYRLIKR